MIAGLACPSRFDTTCTASESSAKIARDEARYLARRGELVERSQVTLGARVLSPAPTRAVNPDRWQHACLDQDVDLGSAEAEHLRSFSDPVQRFLHGGSSSFTGVLTGLPSAWFTMRPCLRDALALGVRISRPRSRVAAEEIHQRKACRSQLFVSEPAPRPTIGEGPTENLWKAGSIPPVLWMTASWRHLPICPGPVAAAVSSSAMFTLD